MLLCCAIGVFAETDVQLSTAVMGLYEKTSIEPDLSRKDDRFSLQFHGAAHLYFFTRQSRTVRARFELVTSFVSSSKGSISLLLEFPKVYLRFRLPVNENYTLRFALGKDIYSWGEGRIYNAADVLNGARYKTNLDAVLVQKRAKTASSESGARLGTAQIIESSSIRNSSVWAASVFIPMGSYTFTELLFAMPNNLERGLLAEYPAPRDPSQPNTLDTTTSFRFLGNGIPDDFFTGFRTQARIAQIKTEFGYAYRTTPLTAQIGNHQPFLSLQGNLFFDWYLAGALHIDNKGRFSAEQSGGIFYTTTVDYVHGLAVRVEYLYRNTPNNELYLFPEITYTLHEQTAMVLGAELYVFDPTAVLIFGLSHDINGLLLSLNINILADTSLHQGIMTVGARYTF